MNSKLGEDLVGYIKTRADKRVGIKEFLDVGNVDLPENIEIAKSRIVINYGGMCGNYILVMGVFLCLYLIFYPILIISGAIWGGVIYLISRDETDEVFLAGSRYKKVHLCYAAGAVSVVFLLFMPRSLVSLFFILGISTIISIGHMVLFKPKVQNEEDI